MKEIGEDEITPKIKEPKILVKEIRVQDTGRQLILQLPSQVVELLNISKGDKFIIKIPLDNLKEYSIKIENAKKNKKTS